MCFIVMLTNFSEYFFSHIFWLFCPVHSRNSRPQHINARRISRDRIVMEYGIRYTCFLVGSRAVYKIRIAHRLISGGVARQWYAIISIVIYDFMRTTNGSEQFLVANRQMISIFFSALCLPRIAKIFTNTTHMSFESMLARNIYIGN